MNKDLLSRRRDLRLILMSATLNVELFSSYFGGAPTIHIPGFTHPVRAHFLEDILERTGYKLTSTNQLDDYGQDKVWKTQRQLLPRKRKNRITTLVERLIFEKPPPNVRKVVLATNMAEASTINDIVFVVDCGKAKETTYDALNNTPAYSPHGFQRLLPIRRGAELVVSNLENAIISTLDVQNAVEFLKMIGALDENENLTDLGRYPSMLPVGPKLGKMLIMGAVFRCIDPVLIVVAGLYVRDPFLLPRDKKNDRCSGAAHGLKQIEHWRRQDVWCHSGGAEGVQEDRAWSRGGTWGAATAEPVVSNMVAKK